jgi:hypothetical protein
MTITPLYASNGGKPVFNEFITPIGHCIYTYHDEPQAVTKDNSTEPQLDEKGFPKAEFKVTLKWPKHEMDTTLVPMRQMAALVRDQAWGPGAAADAWLNLQAFLRDGDNPEHNTKKSEHLFGQVYLNFKGKASPVVINGEFQKRYTGAPGLIGPRNEDLMPTDWYSGAYGRVSGIMFATEYMGKRFISTRLNNIQKGGGPNGDGNGERIGGGGRPDAKSQFEPLQTGPVQGTMGLANLL